MSPATRDPTQWGAGSVRLPRAVWALGGVSLLMDLSSEMIHSLLPVFLVTGLGVSITMLGAIEGVAEATASAVKLVSGAWSDRLGRRKPLALLGYGVAALAKPLFALAASAGAVFLARFLDRIGKGIRGAPRDALVADVTPPELRGAAYGLRQSLDTIGALAGPLVAAVLMVLWDDVRMVFWIAVVPAFASTALLWLAVHETPRAPSAATPAARLPLSAVELSGLGRRCWAVIALTGLLALGRYSEAFLLLHAQGLGLAIAATPLVLVVMNVVYAASAYPAGRLSDHLGRREGVIAVGCLAFVAANLLLATAQGPLLVFAGAALYGLHMGLTQGLLAGLLADAAPPHRRGTAFGVFHLATGVALLPASLGAGLIWDALGAPAPFLVSAALVALAGLGIAALGFERRAPRL